MRRLAAAVGVVVLLGCPNWDLERDRRCLQLDASMGVCAGADAGEFDAGGDVDDGGSDAGGADAGGPVLDIDGGSVPTSLSAVRPTSTLYSYGPTGVRRPVFLWQLPGGGPVVSVEARDGGFSVWRSGDQAAAGSVDQTWCAAAVNASSPLLGNAKASGGAAVSVDDLRNAAVINEDYPLSGSACPAALSAYQRQDGGFAFLAVRPQPAGVRFERASCKSPCVASTFDYALDTPRVDEAATDGTQGSWVSAGVGVGGQSAVLVEVRPDASEARTHVLGSGGVDGVQVSAFGGSIHAAWIDGLTLWLAGLSTNGGLQRRDRWLLPAQPQLVDLVENGNAVVAVFSFAGRNGMLVHTPSANTFYEIQTPFQFRITAASLNQALRLTGQCLFADGGVGGDSSAGCMSASNNPVVEFARNPDGNAW